MTDQTAKEKSPNVFKRTWQFLSRPNPRYAFGVVVILGFVVGVLFWGGFNWAMEMTNNETFCVSCHEMEQNVFREYKNTVHYQNRTGVRATCPDCHVPKEWVHKVARKIRATNELFHHFAGTISTREEFEAKRLELARNVWTVMKNTDSRECRNCHSYEFMDFTVQEARTRPRHADAASEGKTCIDCHKGIAHELPAGAFEAEREMSKTE